MNFAWHEVHDLANSFDQRLAVLRSGAGGKNAGVHVDVVNGRALGGEAVGEGQAQAGLVFDQQDPATAHLRPRSSPGRA